MKYLATATLATFSLVLLASQPVLSQGIAIAPRFQPDPVVLRGTSGGSQASPNCGQLPTTPSHVVQLNSDFPYLRFSLQGQGQPTLMIRLPNGSTSCVSADRATGIINAPGYWEQGSYQLYVGDRTGEQHPYTLSITQQR
ncbi:MAG: hypothetical protein HC916_11125 [Coleofasciculaceae cyanobacterium SM2_1_6]|nr:hypothetical protein [Coleofasciculaceae cyanobacterium SM2_1_6]